jgi:carboxyl-terminal processing protease
MRSNIVKALIGAFVGLLLSALLFTSGIAVGAALPGIRQAVEPYVFPGRAPAPSTSGESGAGTPQELEALFQPFWEAWDIVHERYVDQPVDDSALMQGALRGMLEGLGDPHTSYMDPEQYTQEQSRLEGEYEGIGAWVDPEQEYLTIIAPMPDSPAEKAGLEPGDEIIAVDGEDMTGVPGDLVIRKVMGPAGSVVKLTVRREGEPGPMEFEVERASITIPSVESEMLQDDIAYLQLFNFGDLTEQDLRHNLQELVRQDPKGLILDLRGNPGGFLQTSVDVASEFIGNGVILYERFGDGTEQTYEAHPGGLATEIPLVVLVDQGTASASEIVAGAIQDHDRGLLVGESTFGKGSVQQWIPLSGDQGAVRVTIARWYTPDRQTFSDTGLQPDVRVSLSDEDIQNDNDPQLNKAIELLKEQVGQE